MICISFCFYLHFTECPNIFGNNIVPHLISGFGSFKKDMGMSSIASFNRKALHLDSLVNLHMNLSIQNILGYTDLTKALVVEFN